MDWRKKGRGGEEPSKGKADLPVGQGGLCLSNPHTLMEGNVTGLAPLSMGCSCADPVKGAQTRDKKKKKNTKNHDPKKSLPKT